MAVYQCAPFLVFAKTLSAVTVINDVLGEHDIELPMDGQNTVTDDDRFERGRTIQHPLYGDEIATTWPPCLRTCAAWCLYC